MWLEDAMRAGPFTWTELNENRSADVLIVGGGYAGLWTSLFLKELGPQLEVCLLEADVCGSGASGRNGGFATGWWTRLPILAKAVGMNDGLEVVRLVSA